MCEKGSVRIPIMKKERAMQELQQEEQVRIERAIQEALSYVKGNIFPAISGDRCGDDRSMEEGQLAIFGASTGFVAALMAEGVTPEKSRTVVKSVNEQDGVTSYFFHDDSDGHSCGHEGLLAGEHAAEYGVTPEVISWLKKRNEEDLQNGQAHKETYEGSHQAVRVVRVHGSEFTVRANDGQEKNFIVDVDRIKEKTQRIALAAGVDGQKLFNRIIEHISITASYLAEGLDIFDVFIAERGQIEKIEYGGKVPDPSSSKPETA